MAFVLDSAAPAHQSLRAVAAAECERALERLKRSRAEDIHEARKSLKRLRAWARLLQPHLGDLQRLLKPLLRDSARALAGRRDADVARQTLLGLRRGRRLDATQYAQLLQLIVAAAPDPQQRADANADARRLLKAAQVYLLKLDLAPLTDETLLRALTESRGRCRQHWQRARRARTAEALHDWRKTVKHLAAQATLLAPRLSGVDADVVALKALGEVLGRHHDHADLGRRLDAGALRGQELLRLRVRDALLARMQLLEREALAQGATLFAGSHKPSPSS